MKIRLFTLLLAILCLQIYGLAQPQIFKKTEGVSLKEGELDKKVKGFKPKSTEEANNASVPLTCGTEHVFGYEVTNAAVNAGHYELVNVGTCDITVKVDVLHVEDENGTQGDESISMNVKAGGHGSLTFPISQNKKDLHKFVLIVIKCEVNSEPKARCALTQQLTVGVRAPVEDQTQHSDQVELVQPGQATPVGANVGGAAGSKCSTPDGDFETQYTFYNTVDAQVELTFTVVNECNCEAFVARVTRGKFDIKKDQPLGSKPLKGEPRDIATPAKNEAAKETGSRQVSPIHVKTGESISIAVGCSGANKPTGCKGRVKDIRITLK